MTERVFPVGGGSAGGGGDDPGKGPPGLVLHPDFGSPRKPKPVDEEWDPLSKVVSSGESSFPFRPQSWAPQPVGEVPQVPPPEPIPTGGARDAQLKNQEFSEPAPPRWVWDRFGSVDPIPHHVFIRGSPYLYPNCPAGGDPMYVRDETLL